MNELGTELSLTMLLLAAAVIVTAVTFIVVRRNRFTSLTILGTCTALFLVRAGGVWLGRHILANTGGSLQVPAYFLVMLGWPEITIPLMLGWASEPGHAVIMATGLLAVTSAALGVILYIRGR